MGFNIYEDTVQIHTRRRPSQAGTDKEEAERLFLQHANNDVIWPGTPFNNLCQSLAAAYPDKLAGLTVPQMEGRAWEFFDQDHDGTVSLEEFLTGVSELLNPTTEQARALVGRLECSPSRRGSSLEDYTDVRRVGIVGAGVAGLQVANLLKQINIQCVIFEKTDDVGGVWRENYADFGLQVPRDLYEFPGFPWPTDRKWDWFPKGPEVQEYIQRYAKEFGLYDDCKFQTAVLEVAPRKGSRGWTVKYQTKGASPAVDDFDFLVVATGMYGWPPHIPLARGVEKFKGQILHSCTFTNREVAKDKKVVVVGGGKSAIDNVVAAANGGSKSATLLCREAHWPVPRYLGPGRLVPFKWGTYSRFGHSTLPTHHAETPCAWWCHSLCTPLKWVWWRIVELLFTCKFCIPNKFAPKSRIEVDLFNGGQILTYEFQKMCSKGKVNQVLGAISHYEEDGVVCMDGTKLEADLVIYGTGFSKSYDIFDKSFVQPLLGLEKDGLWLYRNMIPPKLQDLAFIGCEVSTFNNILTHGLQAMWLQRLLSNHFKLPKPRVMEKAIEEERAWKRSWMPPSSARASIWQLHMVKYHDNLVKDVGEAHKRKGMLCCCAEVFAPYTARDYSGLFKLERNSARGEWPAAGRSAAAAPLMVEMKAREVVA